MARTERESTPAMTSIVTSFSDPFWDYGPKQKVEGEVLTRLQRQLQVASRAPAFRGRIPAALLGPRPPLTRADLESLPLLSKHELRACLPDDLLPDREQTYHVVRASGGTTGIPVEVCWTREDWTAAVQAMQRFCEPLKSLRKGFRLWNGYNQAHVSGPAFDDLARALGGTPVPRHFKASDRQAIEDMERIRADALVVTPQSGSGKAGSLEDLLAEDPHFLARLRIRTLLVSSTPLTSDLLAEVREQGVTTVVNFYGSTEAPPAAVSCEVDSAMFHLAQGHVLVEVIGNDGRHVRSGERGAVVVSRIGGVGSTGLLPATGTQLLRYKVGDSALYLDEPCACGRSSSRIGEITRSSNVEDKLKGGCEQWD